jgi:hypothetical protein
MNDRKTKHGQVRTPPYDTVDMPFLKLMVHIGKTEGWKRLYRGLTSAIVGSGLSWALYFGWHEGFKRWILSLRKGRKRLTAADEMLAAAMAGVLTTLIVNPIWVINTRMKVAAKKRLAAKTDVVVPGAAVVVAGGQNGAAVNGGVSNGNGHTNGVGVGKGASEAADGDSGSGKTTNFMELIRKEGLMGWLTGIVPSLLLLINPAIQLLVYARLRRMVQKRFGRAPGASEAAVMGAVSLGFGVWFSGFGPEGSIQELFIPMIARSRPVPHRVFSAHNPVVADFP